MSSGAYVENVLSHTADVRVINIQLILYSSRSLHCDMRNVAQR